MWYGDLEALWLRQDLPVQNHLGLKAGMLTPLIWATPSAGELQPLIWATPSAGDLQPLIWATPSAGDI